jgi:hypothetical protein
MKYIAIVIILLTAIACSKEERLTYEESPSVYFYKFRTNPDSTNYTFVVKPDSVLTDTLYLTLRISGVAVDRDRKVNIVLADSSTAQSGKHFTIPEAIIKAGTYDAKIPVYVLRSPDEKDSIFVAYFNIASSEDFKAGYSGDLTYKIGITDQLIKPSDWSGITALFYGAYSKVKHQFMVSRLGTTAITISTGAQFSEIMSILQKMRVELIKYEAENGPLIDENGVRVTFPVL